MLKQDLSDNSLLETLNTLDSGSDQSTLGSENASVIFGQLRLQKNITCWNFYGSWLNLILVGTILTATATLEPEVLRGPLGISETEIGKTESTLLMIDYGLKICCALMFGPLIDKFGRRPMFIFGLIVAVTGFYLIPYSTDLYTSYLPYKCIKSAGAMALQILPLNADYVHDSYKGVSSGLQYTISFFGAAMTAGILSVLCNYGLTISYWGIGCVVLSIGLINCFLIKGGNTYFVESVESESLNEETKNCKEQAKEVWQYLKEVPWIGMGILTAALTFSDVYLITGITLWMQGLTRSSSYLKATQETTKYQLVFAGFCFFSSLVYGFIITKVKLFKFIMTAMIVSMIGLAFVQLVDGPDSIFLYILFGFEGISLPGVLLFSTFCSVRYNPPKYRGTFAAMGIIFGMSASIALLEIGGPMYDNGIIDAAFLLYGALLVFVAIAMIVLYKLTKSNRRIKVLV